MAILEGRLREQADAIVARYPESRSALLPLLYLAQSVEGHLSREGTREVGELLGLTTAEVEAVATFYTMYKREPTGRWVVSVCTNVSCALLGAREVHEAARRAAEGDEEVEVEAVATFYTMYKREPTGRWVVSVCTNVSCALLGAREVHEAARRAAEGDEEVEVEEVECLGACDAAPVVQVNYCSYDRLSQEGVAELIEALRAGEPPAPARGPRPAPHDETSRILAGLGDDRE